VSNFVFLAIIALAGIGVLAAIILYFVAQRFRVIEDPRIDIVTDLLPAAIVEVAACRLPQFC